MVYILLGQGFEEAEALVTADVLRRGSVSVALTGIGGMTVEGAHGIKVAADAAVDAVSLTAGDTVLLPGGMGGVSSIEGSPAAMELIHRAAADDTMYLAAICAAPTLLGRWGLLEGKQAVCYPGMEDQMTGARVCRESGVAEDVRLITGRAAGSAFDFGLKLVEALSGADKAQEVRYAVHYD